MVYIDELWVFVDEYGLVLIIIVDLIEWWCKYEKYIEWVVEVWILICYGEFCVIGYISIYEDVEYVVLVCGEIVGFNVDGDDVLVWVYLECLIGDVFGLCCCDCGF